MGKSEIANGRRDSEGVELDDEQLDRIAGGNCPDTCNSCGGYIKRFPWGLEICVDCGALYSDPNGEKAPR